MIIAMGIFLVAACIAAALESLIAVVIAFLDHGIRERLISSVVAVVVVLFSFFTVPMGITLIRIGLETP